MGREPVRERLKELDFEDRKTIGEDIKGCRVFLADRNAARSVAWKRAAGGPESIAARAGLPRYFLRRAGLYSVASWIHEEESRDAAPGY
jgi:hypothetical protein